jgi:hypothetical protein
MDYTNKLFEDVAVAGVIDPDAYAANTYLTGAIDMSQYRRVGFIVQVGTMGTSATIDFTIQESDTSAGTYTDVGGDASPSHTITQVTQAGTDQSDTQHIIEIAAEELGAGKRYIKGELVIGTAACDAGVVALGAVARYQPVEHMTSVTEANA